MRQLRELARFLPLFLVSLATVGFEIALTRYFSVAKWSEYGYWVISIVLAGFAFSGVAMALARDWFARRGEALLAWLPAALIATAALGYYAVTINPFNPLQLQNPATIWTEIGWIFVYYAALFPFFFLAGLFISLCFVLNDGVLGKVYGFDLTGAGAGAMVALGLMELVHPFMLVPCLLAPLMLAGLFSLQWRRVAPVCLVLLGLSELLLIGGNKAQFNEFKAIYAPLHTEGAKVLSEIPSARGLYMLLDDFTERVDVDISNDAGPMGLPGPPTTYGLYRDGNRIAALPKNSDVDMRYAAATLDALTYQLKPHAKTLLLGSSGGFHPLEASALGVALPVTMLEPEPELRSILRGPNGQRISSGRSPIAAVAGQRYDIIDIAGDFLDATEANQTAFSVEALTADINALNTDGILSIPVSIREFPAYAVRVLATVRAALLQTGIDKPENHVLVYRSAWNLRILVSPNEFGPERTRIARQFCDDRSFDLSYYPGVEGQKRAEVFNDLPPVSFTSGEVQSSDHAQDAIADEAPLVLTGRKTPSDAAFDLRPITLDRADYYNVLKLSQLPNILARLEILPQQEIGTLVNIAVLGQAIVIALLVLLAPLFSRGRLRSPGISALRAAVYFAALGLGYLFIELYAIDRASFLFNDRTSGFALVLTAMLIFSGLGAMFSSRYLADPARGVDIAIVVAVVWCAGVYFWQEQTLIAMLGESFIVRATLAIVVLAPISFALGMPFPLGLSRMGKEGFMPWAWGLNGAFSVVSTPLANLIAWQTGHSVVLISALALYVVAHLAFPRDRKISP
jgi:MFS family permease